MIDQGRTFGLNPTYCILVSSCDAYSDCWSPFFTLFDKYWRPYNHAIYLNTETQSFDFPGLMIDSPRVERMAGPLAWGDRLLRCLDAIPHEIVLYVQEDYFLKEGVDVELIDQFADLMRCEEDISHISMERGVALTPGHAVPFRFLSRMDQAAEYRISAQVGLWRVSALKSYLRRHETVWEFEEHGTRRARRRKDVFLFLNDEYEAEYGRKLFPYDPTGVVGGRWARDVVEDLFAENGIEVDYAIRGFRDPDEPVARPPLLERATRRLRSLR